MKKIKKRNKHISEYDFHYGSPEYIPTGSDDGIQTDYKSIDKSRKAPIKSAIIAARKFSGKYPNKLKESLQNKLILLSGQYQVINENQPVVEAIVDNGWINSLRIKDKSDIRYQGEALFRLFENICQEADSMSSNIGIDLQESEIDMKYFLERFGFRLIEGSIMVRNYGSIIPAPFSFELEKIQKQ